MSQTLSAKDFNIQHVIEATQSRLTVVASCTMEGYGDPSKLYTVKVLFDDQSTMERNNFENEIQIVSTLSPHSSIVQLLSNFVSTVPESFVDCLPENVQLKFSEERELQRARKKFVVYDYHTQQLSDWLSKNPFPLCLEDALELAEQFLIIFKHLENHQVCLFDIELSDFCKSDSGSIVLHGLQCAVQCTGSSFMLPVSGRAGQCCTDSAYIAPEVLNGLAECRRSSLPTAGEVPDTSAFMYNLY